jgi:hypothetical protein
LKLELSIALDEGRAANLRFGIMADMYISGKFR